MHKPIKKRALACTKGCGRRTKHSANGAATCVRCESKTKK